MNEADNYGKFESSIFLDETDDDLQIKDYFKLLSEFKGISRFH